MAKELPVVGKTNVLEYGEGNLYSSFCETSQLDQISSMNSGQPHWPAAAKTAGSVEH